MSQIPSPRLTPKDKRLVLDALVHAEALMSDRIAACPLVCHVTCPACQQYLDKQNEYRALAARLRGGE
jgi:hypothetical protein